MQTSSSGGIGTAPFTGRAQELADLAEILDRAVQYETPQSVLILGNQGVGKTRLLDQWLQQVARSHPEVRVFRCTATPAGASYSLFASLLRVRFRLSESADAEQSFRTQVEAVFHDRRVTEVLHFLGGFIGISVRENPFLRAMEESPTQHEQISRAVLRRFIEADSQQGPILLVFENLQDADRDSLQLFQELAESLEGAPVILVGSARPDLLVNQPAFGQLDGEHTRIDLPPFGREESALILRQLLSRLSEIPGDLIDSAVDMTGGNPYFMELLVRVLLDQGTIRQEAGAWIIDMDRVEEVVLPMSVEEAVYARISVLTPAERDVLEKAVTLGSVFWLEALVCFSRLQQEIEEKSHIWMADVLQQTIKEILDGLVDRDYLMRLPDSSIPDAAEYAFKHNMERELITKMVNPTRLRTYHRFAAQWLETKLPDRSEAQLEYLGQHYQLGGNNRRAAFCFVHAGDKARARYAFEQAATYYRKGVDLLDLDDALSAIEGLYHLGDVCSILGRTEEALEHFSEMLRYAWLLDHKTRGASAHRRIGGLHLILGDYDRALGHLNMALRLFERAADRRGLSATLDDAGQLQLNRGEYERALEYHQQALEIRREVGDPRAIAESLNNIGTVHQNSGAFREAQECYLEALEIRKEVEDRMGVVSSLTNLGAMHRAKSDYSQAFELWTEALDLARELGDRLHEIHLLINLGEAQLQLGQPREAERYLREASKLAHDLGDRRLIAECTRTLAEVSLAVGDLQTAEAEAQRALEVSEKLGLKPEMGLALRALAEVAAAREIDETNQERSTLLFQRAIALFSEMGNDLELARTYSRFADYHDRCGKWKEADHFRTSADAIFDRMKNLRSPRR